MAAVYRELTANNAVPTRNTTQEAKEEINKANIG